MASRLKAAAARSGGGSAAVGRTAAVSIRPVVAFTYAILDRSGSVVPGTHPHPLLDPRTWHPLTTCLFLSVLSGNRQADAGIQLSGTGEMTA